MIDPATRYTATGMTGHPFLTTILVDSKIINSRRAASADPGEDSLDERTIYLEVERIDPLVRSASLRCTWRRAATTTATATRKDEEEASAVFAGANEPAARDAKKRDCKLLRGKSNEVRARKNVGKGKIKWNAKMDRGEILRVPRCK